MAGGVVPYVCLYILVVLYKFFSSATNGCARTGVVEVAYPSFETNAPLKHHVNAVGAFTLVIV